MWYYIKDREDSLYDDWEDVIQVLESIYEDEYVGGEMLFDLAEENICEIDRIIDLEDHCIEYGLDILDYIDAADYYYYKLDEAAAEKADFDYDNHKYD